MFAMCKKTKLFFFGLLLIFFCSGFRICCFCESTGNDSVCIHLKEVSKKTPFAILARTFYESSSKILRVAYSGG